MSTLRDEFRAGRDGLVRRMERLAGEEPWIPLGGCRRARELLSWCCVVAVAACATPRAGRRPIETARPSVSEYTGVVGRGVVQAEGGYSVGRRGGTTSQSLGELLLRVGVSARAEVRAGLNAVEESGRGSARATGIDDAAVSVKARLFSGGEDARLSGVALIAGTRLPTGDRAVADRAWEPEAMLSTDWRLTDRLQLTPSVDYVHASENRARVGRATGAAAVAYSLTRRWQPQVEYLVRRATRGRADVGQQILAALAYLVGPDLHVDVWGARAFGEGGETRVGGGLARRW